VWISAQAEMSSNAYALAVESDSTHKVDDQDNDENRAKYAAADVHVDLLWFSDLVIQSPGPPLRLLAGVHRCCAGFRTSGLCPYRN
jgi:hypothetical protein